MEKSKGGKSSEVGGERDCGKEREVEGVDMEKAMAKVRLSVL